VGAYDTQQVCLNGHQVTDSFHRRPQDRAKHCAKCGAPTIHQCPACSREIKGDYHSENVVVIGGAPEPVPTHCEECGTPFPWAKGERELSTVVDTGQHAVELLERICLRFHLVARQLRQRREDRDTLDVNDEYDVQDLLHSLLHLGFDDIRPEEWTPSYAGKSSRMDFLLKREGIVLEAKKTRAGLGGKEIGDQLLVDIARYQGHPACKTLFCFVYDPEGRISNPRGLEADLTRTEGNLTVRVFIVPRAH
jgi:hypothetical protein